MRILLFLLSFLIVSVLNAQRDTSSTLAFGFGGGFYSSSIDLANTTRSEYKLSTVPGTQFGAAIRYFNNKAVGFVGELNFTTGGWKEQAVENGPAYIKELSYFEVQILTQVALGRKMFRPLLQAGPYFAFPIAQKDAVPADFPIPEEDNYYGTKLPFRPNYGLSIGGGLLVQIERIGLQLEGRYQAGLSDLVRSGDLGVSVSRRRATGGRLTVFYELAR